jgi:hypothetical protein
MSFPVSPTNGQIAVVNGIKYSYSAATSSWTRIPLGTFVAGTSSPSDPALGDHWYNTATDVLYEFISDGTNTFWVDIETPIISANATSTIDFYGNLNPYPTLGNLGLTGNIRPTANLQYTIGTRDSYLSNLFASNVTLVNGTKWANGTPYGSQVSRGTTAPTGSTEGDFWYNTTTNILYRYTNDGSSSFWVDIESPTIGSNVFAGSFVSSTFVATSSLVDLGSLTNPFGNIYAGNIFAGGARSTTSSSAPSNPSVGDIWYNTTNDIKYRWTYDGSGYYWVDYDTSVVSTTYFSGNILSTDLIPVTGQAIKLGTQSNPFNSVYGQTVYTNLIENIPGQSYVSISTQLQPDANLTYDIGTNTLQFANIWAGNIFAGGARSTTAALPPTNPSVGDVWYNSDTDIKYRYTFDGTSKYWVDEVSTVVSSLPTYAGNVLTENLTPAYSGNIDLGNVTSAFGNLYVSNVIAVYNQVLGGNLTAGNITLSGNIVGGGVRSTTSSTPPANPTVGDIWYDSDIDVKYRYTFDGTSNYWVDETSFVAGATYFSGNILGTDLIPQTGQSVKLGTESNPFNSVYGQTAFLNAIDNIPGQNYVEVSTALMPDTATTYDVGSATYPFGNIYAGNIFAGGARQTVATSAPTSPPPSVGDQWYNPDIDALYQYIDDGTTKYWVDRTSPTTGAVTYNGNLFTTDLLPVYSGNLSIGSSVSKLANVFTTNLNANTIVADTVVGGGVRSTTSSTPPANPVVGDIWYDSDIDVKYRYTFDGTASYWVDDASSTYGANYYSANIIASDIIPNTGVPVSLGSQTNPFNKLYASTIYTSAIDNIPGGGPAALGTALAPDADLVYDIGTSLNRLANVYAGGLTVGAGTGNAIVVNGNITPTGNGSFSLGSTTNRYKDLWVSTSGINIGGAVLSSDGANLTLTNNTGAVYNFAGPGGTADPAGTAVLMALVLG